MERRYLKYEWANKNAFDIMKDTHLTDEEGNLLKGIHVVEIGDIVKTPAVMSEDGETIVTPAVMSNKWAVDILWEIEIPTQFEALEKYPKGQVVHTFAGIEGLYTKELHRKFPELKPVEE